MKGVSSMPFCSNMRAMSLRVSSPPFIRGTASPPLSFASRTWHACHSSLLMVTPNTFTLAVNGVPGVTIVPAPDDGLPGPGPPPPPAPAGRGVPHLKQNCLEANTLAPHPGQVQSPGRPVRASTRRRGARAQARAATHARGRAPATHLLKVVAVSAMF